MNRDCTVKRIVVGLILGAILGVAAPATSIAILGDVFVGAPKLSHLLVFFRSQFTVQRRKIPWRRYQNSSCLLHVQYCTGSCDRRFLPA